MGSSGAFPDDDGSALSARDASKTGKTIVVAGAGPAGLLAAAVFASKGYNVEVFEKRPPPDPNKDHTHSFTIVLNPKGLTAIKEAGGIDCSHLLDYPLLACVRHSANGRYSSIFLQPKPGAAAQFERSELTHWLYQSVCKRYPSVRFHFQTAVSGLDINEQVLFIAKAGEQACAVRYDLLVAADGANSAVRSSLQKQVPGFACQHKDVPLVYKRFKNVPGTVPLNARYGSNGSVLHFYGILIRRAMKGHAALWGFLSIINSQDGSLAGGLSVYAAAKDMLVEEQDYMQALAKLPLPADMRQAISRKLVSAPWTWGGAWVHCSQLHGPRVVVLGDAGHAVSPSMGQGCNASLEDVHVLQQVLEEVGEGHLEAVPEEFSKRRLDEVHALVWIDEHARAFRGQLGITNPHFIMYMGHMYCRALLSRLLPGLVDKPALQRVWEEPVPYTTIKRALQADGATLTWVGGALAAGICVTTALAVGRRLLTWCSK